jgi:hypothetical protein
LLHWQAVFLFEDATTIAVWYQTDIFDSRDMLTMANLYLTVTSGIIVAVGLLYSGSKIIAQVFENDGRWCYIWVSFGVFWYRLPAGFLF